MRALPLLVAAILLAGPAIISPTASFAQDKCAANDLSNSLHERLKKEGKSNAEIREILGSSMKRRVMRSRVADGSGCTTDQVEKALKVLEVAAKG
jgi:hypothetical protein